MNPIGHSFTSTAERLREHAATLRLEALSPAGEMLPGSIFVRENFGPDFAQKHAIEGKKFAALAYQVAPPNLVASMAKDLAQKSLLVATRLNEEGVAGDFSACLLEPKKFSYPSSFPSVTSAGEDFVRYCGTFPSFLLSFSYLAATAQVFIHNIARDIDDPAKVSLMMGIAKHFPSTNLLLTLPFHCWMTKRIEGADSSVFLRPDRELARGALESLRRQGKFSVGVPGQQGTVHCPMQGYLLQLIVHEDTLGSISDAISIYDVSPSALPEAASHDIYLAHIHNRIMVCEEAGRALLYAELMRRQVLGKSVFE